MMIAAMSHAIARPRIVSARTTRTIATAPAIAPINTIVATNAPSRTYSTRL